MDEKRTKELAQRSLNKKIFVFTDFLNEREQQEIKNAFPQDFVTFLGGAEFSERKIARFGYADFAQCETPLCVLKLHPLGGKFSTAMHHRDVLGAIMSLGVVREKVGDVFCQDDCFAVVHKSICKFLQQNLVQVGKNAVEVTESEVLSSCAPNLESRQISAQSNRVDALLSKIFALPREKACYLVETGNVAIDGTPCEKSARALKTGEKVSVRGFGKFVFVGEKGTSKKGKTYFEVQIYV